MMAKKFPRCEEGNGQIQEVQKSPNKNPSNSHETDY